VCIESLFTYTDGTAASLINGNNFSSIPSTLFSTATNCRPHRGRRHFRVTSQPLGGVSIITRVRASRRFEPEPLLLDRASWFSTTEAHPRECWPSPVCSERRRVPETT
jgi:hypothetical protein